MSKSATTTEAAGRLVNPTPGAVLMEDFLRPLGMSQTALAGALGVSPRRVNEIVLGKRGDADTDLRLARYWGLTPGFWPRLQIDHDLMNAAANWARASISSNRARLDGRAQTGRITGQSAGRLMAFDDDPVINSPFAAPAKRLTADVKRRRRPEIGRIEPRLRRIS